MKRFIKPFVYFLVITAIFYMINANIIPNNTAQELSYTEFLEKAEYGDIEKIEMNGETIKAYPYESTDYYIVQNIENHEFVEQMREQDIEVKSTKTTNNGLFINILSLILSFAPFVLLIWLFNRMTGNFGREDEENASGGFGMLFGAGKSKTKLYKQTDTGVKFADVAGQEEAKESLKEIIDYLHNADKYSSIGAKLPKGALLIGPPGTGKTLLAKAVAGEANVPFYSITGSDFVEMFVGVGASRVRDMFAEAKKNSPCIVFIDEIDAIGKSRSGSARTGGNDEREQTLNQLLSEMDGFDSTTAVVILAATNRPEILDKALTRPGRFDRRVIVDKPDLKGREDILKVHSKDVHMDETVDLSAIAKATAGGVGADLSNIINEAALRAVRMGRTLVSQEDLVESVEVVFAGKEKKDRILSKKEREIVAYHEVGHAVIAALQKNSEPVQKITIVPRTSGALGFTMQIPEEEKFLSSKEEILTEIRTLIGGRCAEEVFFNTITTGASNDIEKITKLAKEMITVYGMNERFDMVGFESQESIYLNENGFRTCSEEYSALIDSEMIKIVQKCHNQVFMLLKENENLVHEVAALLLEQENLTGKEFMAIFRKYHKEAPNTEDDANKKVVKPEKKATKIEPSKEVTSNNEKHIEKKEETKNIPAKSLKEDEPEKHKKQKQKQEDPSVLKNSDKQKLDLSNKDDKEKKDKSDIADETVTEIDIEENNFEVPPEQDMFEQEILEQMDFDNAVKMEEEPPMPDFDSMFESKGKTEKIIDATDKHSENISKQKEHEKQKNSPNEKKQDEKKDVIETKEPQKKPAFEAPKPLKKKKKNKGNNGAQGEKAETQNEPSAPNKTESSKDNERNDMALLMNSLKTNPEELAQRRKNGKYINNGQNAKNNTSDVLTPDSKAEDFKNVDLSDFDLSRKAEEVSEDDY